MIYEDVTCESTPALDEMIITSNRDSASLFDANVLKSLSWSLQGPRGSDPDHMGLMVVLFPLQAKVKLQCLI